MVADAAVDAGGGVVVDAGGGGVDAGGGVDGGSGIDVGVDAGGDGGGGGCSVRAPGDGAAKSPLALFAALVCVTALVRVRRR